MAETTCILHIGLEKTGSTALQHALAEGREPLRAAGIDTYPHGTSHTDLVVAAGYAGGAVGRTLRARGGGAPEGRARLVDAARARLGSFLDVSDAPTVLFSTEFASLMEAEEVTWVRDWLRPRFARMRIVAYVRPPAEWVRSRIKERVRGGLALGGPHHGGPDASFAPDMARRHLGRWIDAFGASAVEIRDARRAALRGGDVVADFAEAVLGRPAASLGLAGASRNVAASDWQFRAQAAVNAAFDDGEDIGHMGRATGWGHALRDAEAEVRARADGPAPMPRIDFETYAREAADTVAWLHEVTGGAVDFRDVPVPPPIAPRADDASFEVFALAAHAVARRLQDERDVARARLRMRMAVTRRQARNIAALRGEPVPPVDDADGEGRGIADAAMRCLDVALRRDAARFLERYGWPDAARDVLEDTARRHPDADARAEAAAALAQARAALAPPERKGGENEAEP